jgi:hypothetical protein
VEVEEDTEEEGMEDDPLEMPLASNVVKLDTCHGIAMLKEEAKHVTNAENKDTSQQTVLTQENQLEETTSATNVAPMNTNCLSVTSLTPMTTLTFPSQSVMSATLLDTWQGTVLKTRMECTLKEEPVMGVETQDTSFEIVLKEETKQVMTKLSFWLSRHSSSTNVLLSLTTTLVNDLKNMMNEVSNRIQSLLHPLPNFL